MSTLFIVATPIGNLEDITLRALRILREVDVVLCEDTRVTKKLLSHYEISTPVESYHAHSTTRKSEKILNWLRESKHLALVVDAGTPGISDPGVDLVKEVREALGDTVRIEAVPGASALVAALSITGIPAHTFTFFGFPPHKKGRNNFFDTVIATPHMAIFYESTHRLVKALEVLNKRADTRQVTVVKEITKIHERVLTGTAIELIELLKQEPALIKGEFVVIVHPIDF